MSIGSLWLLSVLPFVYPIPLDNGIRGPPEIDCGPSSIAVSFTTREPFEGHVFVRGLYHEPGCRSDEGGRRAASIELPFDTCHVERTRSMSPRGIFVRSTVIVSFHPQFVTEVDRAYRIECFYEESVEEVTEDFQVRELSTETRTEIVDIPTCSYSLLSSLGGPSVASASVGEEVVHSWSCSPTRGLFCMVVHSCFVDDGRGQRHSLVDDHGCPLDQRLLRPLQYSSDLQVWQKGSVFKFADREEIFYDCRIGLSVKDPLGECPVPVCDGTERRTPRNVVYEGVVDVATQLERVEWRERRGGEGGDCHSPLLLSLTCLLLLCLLLRCLDLTVL